VPHQAQVHHLLAVRLDDVATHGQTHFAVGDVGRLRGQTLRREPGVGHALGVQRPRIPGRARLGQFPAHQRQHIEFVPVVGQRELTFPHRRRRQHFRCQAIASVDRRQAVQRLDDDHRRCRHGRPGTYDVRLWFDQGVQTGIAQLRILVITDVGVRRQAPRGLEIVPVVAVEVFGILRDHWQAGQRTRDRTQQCHIRVLSDVAAQLGQQRVYIFLKGQDWVHRKAPCLRVVDGRL